MRHAERDQCIVVDGSVYCKERQGTRQDAGFTILALVTILLYGGIVMWLSVDVFENGWIAVAGFAVPAVIVGLVLAFL